MSKAAPTAALVLIVIAVFASCDSMVNFVTGPRGTDGFATVPSDFSEDPTSPGGTLDPGDDGTSKGGEGTQSFFTAFQIDPVNEDSAGPKFVKAADIDQDGLLDLVSAWNESQPIQLHLQRRDANNDVSFRTITLGGTTPFAIVAGVDVGHINDDGWLDVVVLVKATGFATFCPAPEPEPGEEQGPPTPIGVMDGEVVVLFNPGDATALTDGDNWTEMVIPASKELPGIDEVEPNEAATKPEINGFTSLAVGEIDGNPGDDIVVSLNPAECETLGQSPPINRVELYANPGGVLSEDGVFWTKVGLEFDAPKVSDLELLDVDGDGDLDIVSCWTNAISQNVRWTRNPFVPHQPGGAGGTDAVLAGAGAWEHRPIGALNTGANVMALGDLDLDGGVDIVVRSTEGRLIQWYRLPTQEAQQPEFPPIDPVPGRTDFPWQVYTLFEFSEQQPEGIAVGDLTGDGVLEVVAAAQGQVVWLGRSDMESTLDEWDSSTILIDEGSGPIVVTTDPTTGMASTSGSQSTHVNTLLVIDLDGDGRNDIIGTLDRRLGSGLSADALVWFRNTRSLE